jgi:ABC-type phosphate transport system permease subunit
MVRANSARTVRTILSVIAFFALLTGSWFISDGIARISDASGRGLYWIFEHIVFYAAIMITIMMLFSVFSVTAGECRQDERNLRSAGATKIQIFRSLFLRAMALDLVGAGLHDKRVIERY